MLHRRALLAVLALPCSVALVWACGGDDTSAPRADAGPDALDAAVIDTSPPRDVVFPDTAPLPDLDGGPMCDPAKPFDPPTLVTELDTTTTEASLRLSYDGLTGYFASARDGGQGGVDLWSGTRAKLSDPFGAITNIDVLNSPQLDSHPSITADGLTLVYESTRISPSASVLIARRPNAQSPFNPPDGIPGFGAFAVVTDPFVRADGQVLYISAAPQNGDFDLYRTFKSGKFFVNATNVGELNSQAQEELPTVSPNDHLMYFTSTRIEPGVAGGFDIWLSTRISINVPYTSPTQVKELNTTNDDFPDYISPDGCTLYFHRSISTDAGPSKAIWVAHKTM